MRRQAKTGKLDRSDTRKTQESDMSEAHRAFLLQVVQCLCNLLLVTEYNLDSIDAHMSSTAGQRCWIPANLLIMLQVTGKY